MFVGTSVRVSSIASRVYERFKAAGHVSVPDTFQYLGMAVTRDRSKRSIAINQIGYINHQPDCFEKTDCPKRSTSMEVGSKPRAIQPELREQPFDCRTYQKAIGSILYTALGTRPDITYAMPVLSRYATKPSTLHWKAVKHLLRYLQVTSDYKFMIYDPSLGHNSESILFYADADWGGEADTSHEQVYLRNCRRRHQTPRYVEVEEAEHSGPINTASRYDSHSIRQSAERHAAIPHL